MTDLTPGKRYAITYEITVADDGGIPSWFRMLEESGLTGTPGRVEQLPDPMPQWQVGDVIAWDEANRSDGPKMRHVVMRIYTFDSRPYWRDAAAHPELGTLAEISDERVAELWDAGELEIVARDGRPWPKP